jgi:UDP-N-acetyl-D-mannosaminuronic acid transferase (WecB/TagA/CpsF family)
VWVGLGRPRPEEFLARMKDRLPWGVYLAVGAAFYLCAEPQRLWRPYLVHNSLFVWGVLREVVRRRR